MCTGCASRHLFHCLNSPKYSRGPRCTTGLIERSKAIFSSDVSTEPANLICFSICAIKAPGGGALAVGLTGILSRILSKAITTTFVRSMVDEYYSVYSECGCGEGLICVSPAAFHGFVDCPFQSCGAKIRQRRIRPSWNAGSYSRITSCACTRHRHQQILAPIEPGRTSPGQWEPPPDLRPGFNSLGHCAPPLVRSYLFALGQC